ncbi:uncharacterized protein LY79DRAFT_298 [Colletotrichum navitas]|uniref:DNA binding domain with preference for A/T rich regions-like protein n=1 Tax=Colletotrichum navitas TaxID=681940 RepID=A0AAD8QC81_9PEZI|nr:uncharacterized protein LY79DRAFT_298 [Colletotrichum navitas]KAK1599926.1 hypothetical protein LY79DRAFT_298 [Colletotrichum navitas]
MATTAASLQPLKPVASTSLEHSGTRTGTEIVTPIRSTSQTFVSGSTKQKDNAHGFGILQHTGPPAKDDILGLYRDGRVRNPVPSKLKGKTDARKGNFGVMHIDLSTTNETQERDAAAKRTSEGTQLAAKRAQTDRYVPFKRSKFIYRPEDQVASSPQQSDGAWQRTSPLTVAETKAEQARLLSLLRSLQPVLVVDQLCKALAFFGEGSDTQSPANEAFPDSAKANGPGSLFVGWLAEIFPALGEESIQSVQHPPLKRPRGRPKGSKNTKGKKDNVARKRFVPAGPSADPTGYSLVTSGLVRESVPDDSWVDMDNTTGNEGQILEGQLERSSTTPSRNDQVMAGPNAADSVLGSAPAKAAPVTLAPKRRGRPKGSKNRPKQKTILNDEIESAQDASSAATGSIMLSNEVADDARSSAVSIPSNTPNDPVEPGMVGVKKRKPGPGRPKGSKNRPKETVPAFEHNPHSMPALTNIDHREQEVVPNAAEYASHSSSAITILPLVQTEPPQNTVAVIHRPSLSEPAREAVRDDLKNGGDSKGIKRKRKSAQEGIQSNPYDVHYTIAPAPAQSPSETVETVTSHRGSSPQLARYHDSINPGSARAYQPAKRPRVSTELQQERELSGHIRQAIQTESHRSQPDSSAGHYEANLDGLGGSSLQKSRHQLSISASRSTLQQTPNNRQSELDTPVGFSSNRGTPGTSQQQAERPEVMNTFTMNIPRRAVQGIHDQVQPTQSHQRHQQQQQQQPSPTHKQPITSQHRLTNPKTGQMTSTARQSGSPFTSSISGRDYHELTSVQQPPFNAQMAVPIPTQETNHHSPMPRSMQHHPPALQKRQAHRSQSSDLSSFQDYSDSSFLDVAGLDSASQASLNLNSTSYDIGDGALQRASPNIHSSYGPASSMNLPSFDGGNTESALRERMYHSLRR